MGKHILIIEDDPFTKQFYKIIFHKRNFRLSITENGDEFFDVLENEDISLIILDINLTKTYVKGTKVNGMEISKMIRDNPDYSDIPILIITAYKNQVEEETNIIDESKADDIITKPINDYTEFLEHVESLINK